VGRLIKAFKNDPSYFETLRQKESSFEAKIEEVIDAANNILDQKG